MKNALFECNSRLRVAIGIGGKRHKETCIFMAIVSLQQPIFKEGPIIFAIIIFNFCEWVISKLFKSCAYAYGKKSFPYCFSLTTQFSPNRSHLS